MIHTQLDEEIFFPACRAATAEEKVEEAQVAHDSAKILIADLMREDPRDRYRDAKVKVLAGQVKAQIGAEESADGLFAAAQKAGVNNTELGSRIAHRRRALEAHARSNDLPVPRPVLLCAQALDDFNGEFDKEDDMNSQSTSGRDDRGHFTSDDDGGSSRRSSAARNEGSSRSRSRDDDDDRRRSRSQSREDDDNGRRRGGWFGDSEGHSRAARERWEDERGGSRSRSRDDDDDDRRRSRSQSREDDEDGRHRGGWFGDSEGHARAARERWEDERVGSRSRSRDDDDDDRRRSRSQSREDDDDGRRRGGWFGDPEGHAEAARRGWEERR